jgi:hypothetical protein
MLLLGKDLAEQYTWPFPKLSWHTSDLVQEMYENRML